MNSARKQARMLIISSCSAQLNNGVINENRILFFYSYSSTRPTPTALRFTTPDRAIFESKSVQ